MTLNENVSLVQDLICYCYIELYLFPMFTLEYALSILKIYRNGFIIPILSHSLPSVRHHHNHNFHTTVLEHTRHTSALTVAQKHNKAFRHNSTETKKLRSLLHIYAMTKNV